MIPFRFDHIVLLYVLFPIIVSLFLLLFQRSLRSIVFSIVITTVSILFVFSVLWWSYAWPYEGFGLFADGTTRIMLVWTSFFAWIVSLYARGYFTSEHRSFSFYVLSLISLGLTFFTFLADHMILLAIGWGLLGVMLYLMVGLSGNKAKETAKKTFIMVGGSDIFMILGMLILFTLSGITNLSSAKVILDNPLAYLSFALLFIGAFAKAGVFPFHSWLPDACQYSYVPVTAFLPLSLDKLLGIYLMIRLVGSVFTLNYISVVIMMSLGCLCIFVGVLMALVQHDLRRLLGYHAISQVGYMVLGLGTGTMMGMIGAIYHMMNHTVYKTLLFISGGMIEKECKTTDLDKLGGLIRFLPITFTVMMISSLAISGVFPLNGYFSKHVILHGVMYTQKYYSVNFWHVFWLLASIGGLLTLTSFVKVIYALFIEKPCQVWSNIKENNGWMLIPMILLASLCLLLGLTAETWTNSSFLFHVFNKETNIHFIKMEGFIYLFAYSAIAFFLIKLLKRHTRVCHVRGIQVFEKLRNSKGLKRVYDWSESHYMDLYDIGRRGITGTSSIIRSFHTGILPTYVFWFLIGAFVFALYYFHII
jgi:NADH:ubiquinone oxidoreductase subunit 5 (subunit L)/multisubunit Na+/H+ antiporter MnhA subunit